MLKKVLLVVVCIWPPNISAEPDRKESEFAVSIRSDHSQSSGMQYVSPKIFDSHWLKLGFEIAFRTFDTVDTETKKFGIDLFGEGALVLAGDEKITDTMESHSQLLVGMGNLKGLDLDGQEITMNPAFLDCRLGVGFTHPKTPLVSNFGVSYRQDFFTEPLLIQGRVIDRREAGIYFRTGFRF